jgi:hypothetical protein
MIDIYAALWSRSQRPRRRRPGAVVAAGALLAVGGVLVAGEALLSLLTYLAGMSVYLQPGTAVGVLLHAVLTAVGVLVGATLVTTACFTVYGHRWAQIVNWVLGIPLLLWYGMLLSVPVAFSVQVAMSGPPVASDHPATAYGALLLELERRHEQAWPSWLGTLDWALITVIPLVVLAALACQAVDTADAYLQALHA